MNILGTRNIWKSRSSTSNKSEKDSQILKNKGYISVFIEKVFYNAAPTFFQNIFGGKDKVAITTTVIYKTPGQPDIEAKIVLGSTSVNAKYPSILSKSSQIALNVPSQAEGLELKTTITSIKKDNFERTIDLLSDESFQTPLQLDPVGVGQVLTIAKMVRRIFLVDETRAELEGSYAGLIGTEAMEQPVENNRLADGYLIMISNMDKNNDFWNNFDPELLTYEGKELKYNGEKVTLTHIIYSIHSIPARGINEQSVWAKQYQTAVGMLDDLMTVFTRDEQQNILKKALEEWKKGTLLLDKDNTYIQAEKNFIKQQKYMEILKTFKQYSSESPLLNMDTVELTRSLLGKGGNRVVSPADEEEREVPRSINLDGPSLSFEDQLMEEMERNVKEYEALLEESGN